MRILVADDDPTSRTVLTAMLTKWGYDVVAASDGDEAWRMLVEPDHPRLLILDWIMPGMDGIEIVRKLRAAETDDSHYIIMLTARDDKQYVVEALNAGADDYVTKPYDIGEMRARVGVGRRVVELQSMLACRLRDLNVANAAIAELAGTDELTKLANRRTFNERVSAEISAARRHGYPFSLVMADLDRFKKVNDSYGHDVGDRVLQAFADVLKSTARKEDLVARWGGEEFTVLLPHTAAGSAVLFAERVRKAFAETRCEGVNLRLSASFGVADLEAEEGADSLIQRADNALLQAKQNGRNRVVATSSESVETRGISLNDRRTIVENTVILIVDDDPITTKRLVSIFHKAGFKTASAADGREAIDFVCKWPPNLILLDVHLPDMDGFDACRAIKNACGDTDIPVIFISADNDVSTKVKGFEAGGIDYITKPLEPAEIIARARTHLSLRHAYETVAKLHAEHIEQLAATQKMILPQSSTLPDARFAVSIKQIHQAGGDFYDVIQVGDFLVDYVVADASGHKPETSLWTFAMKALIQEYAKPLFTPLNILQEINRSLHPVLVEGMFFTTIYARLNRRTGRLILANAGHPPAICLRRDRVPEVIRQSGDVIGPFASVGFDVAEVRVEAGDRFFIYTDGLVEAGGNVEKGVEKLVEVCGANRDLALEAMVQKIMAEMVGSDVARDDIVLMGVEI